MLGIWWRRLTWVGAAAGLVAGGGLAIAAVATTIARGGIGNGWIGALLAQPAAWTVPIGLCRHDRRLACHPSRIAPNVGRTMVRLHAPESLDLDRGRHA